MKRKQSECGRSLTEILGHEPVDDHPELTGEQFKQLDLEKIPAGFRVCVDYILPHDTGAVFERTGPDVEVDVHVDNLADTLEEPILVRLYLKAIDEAARSMEKDGYRLRMAGMGGLMPVLKITMKSAQNGDTALMNLQADVRALLIRAGEYLRRLIPHIDEHILSIQ